MLILKTVVHKGSVTLDKSVPTHLLSLGTLGT